MGYEPVCSSKGCMKFSQWCTKTLNDLLKFDSFSLCFNPSNAVLRLYVDRQWWNCFLGQDFVNSIQTLSKQIETCNINNFIPYLDDIIPFIIWKIQPTEASSIVFPRAFYSSKCPALLSKVLQIFPKMQFPTFFVSQNSFLQFHFGNGPLCRFWPKKAFWWSPLWRALFFSIVLQPTLKQSNIACFSSTPSYFILLNQWVRFDLCDSLVFATLGLPVSSNLIF